MIIINYKDKNTHVFHMDSNPTPRVLIVEFITLKDPTEIF